MREVIFCVYAGMSSKVNEMFKVRRENEQCMAKAAQVMLTFLRVATL